MENGECRRSLFLDLKDEFTSSSMLFFALLEDPWKYALIGVMNYGRMKSCGYKKDDSFTMWRSFFVGFWARQKKAKYSNVGLCW
jgi:hypothetical protein